MKLKPFICCAFNSIKIYYCKSCSYFAQRNVSQRNPAIQADLRRPVDTGICTSFIAEATRYVFTTVFLPEKSHG